MRVMSTFSAGLMVGTALIVILPEGVETLYRWDLLERAGGVLSPTRFLLSASNTQNATRPCTDTVSTDARHWENSSTRRLD